MTSASDRVRQPHPRGGDRRPGRPSGDGGQLTDPGTARPHTRRGLVPAGVIAVLGEIDARRTWPAATGRITMTPSAAAALRRGAARAGLSKRSFEGNNILPGGGGAGWAAGPWDRWGGLLTVRAMPYAETPACPDPVAAPGGGG